jgi:uncharacterized protein (TIGR03437 family)
MTRDAENDPARPRSGLNLVKAILRTAILFWVSTCVLAPAFGQSQSFTGTFGTDAGNPGFSFILSGSAPVIIRTYSYAGGKNSAGQVIPEGGFDPTISLYDGGGNFIVGNRDGGCGNVAADAVTSFCWDSYLNVTLPAGAYTVVLTQSENLPNGPTLTNSFVYAGQPNFTTPPGSNSSGFWDLFPSKRTSAYALDVTSAALVTPAAPPPVIQPPAPLTFTTSGTLGGFIPSATISGAFAATGGYTPYTFSAVGFPSGLSLNSKTGAFSGTAGNPGVYNFTVQVSDAESPVATATLAVNYSVLGITTSALPVGSTTSGYSANVAAIGGTGPYAFSATGLPKGLSISGAGAITGTPTASGTFTVVIQVNSGGLATTSTFQLDVTPAATQKLIVTSAPLPVGTVSTPYSSTTGLQASGGVPPYTWSVFGGVLPTGMSLSSSGNLQGTPTLAATYGFTAQSTDSTGVVATGTFSLVVNPPPLTFSLGTFPTGVAGSEYPLQILTGTVTGGQPAYTFTLATGPLPAGLILSGQEISGTPTTAGTFPFVISVTDASGKTLSANGSILIVPAQTTLILSQSTVSFSLTAGASVVPTPAHVTVRSSVVGTPLPYSLTVSPTASWLDVSGGSTTPGSINISIDPTAPSLAASATPYSTNITISCVPSTACGGLVQNIAVGLAVTATPPLLTVSSSLLSFTAYNSNPVPSSQTLGLQNSGGGTIDISSVTTGASWLTVTGVPATLTAGPATLINVTANPSGLSAGYYNTTLTVSSSAGSVSIPVTLLVAQSLTMTVDPSGTQFSVSAGSSPGNASGSFNVSAAGSGTVNWSAALAPGANWITLNTPSGTSTGASAGLVSYSLNPGVITALAPATYFATINVSATGVADPLQQFQVVLNVMAADSTVSPVLSSAGLIFSATAGGAASPQTVQVYANAGQVVTPYQASASTTDGASWLAVSPATGFATVLGAAQSSVSVNVTGLAPGVYSGGVSYAFSSDAVRTVNVTLLILNSGAAAAIKGASPETTTSCTPTKLIGTQTSLYNNFAQAAGWPTPLSVNLMNDCGSPVNGASLTTTFSNGDPPMALSPRDTVSGVYVGTWTPRNLSSQVTVTATAMAPPLPVATTQVTGEVRSNITPVLTPNGMLDVFNPVLGSALAPGQVVQIYGTNLAIQTEIAPVPLPMSVVGTTVLIGGMVAPLFYVSPSQIDAQIPFGLNPGSQYQVIVEVNASLSTPMPIQLDAFGPALANISGEALAEHLDGTLVTDASPAQPSEYVVLFLSGLGATTNPVPAGAITPSPSDPSLLSIPLVTPTMTLNGASIPIVFVGLAPTAVGLYQIDFQVPATIQGGDLPLVVMQGTTVSNTVLLPTSAVAAQ